MESGEDIEEEYEDDFEEVEEETDEPIEVDSSDHGDDAERLELEQIEEAIETPRSPSILLGGIFNLKDSMLEVENQLRNKIYDLKHELDHAEEKLGETEDIRQKLDSQTHYIENQKLVLEQHRTALALKNDELNDLLAHLEDGKRELSHKDEEIVKLRRELEDNHSRLFSESRRSRNLESNQSQERESNLKHIEELLSQVTHLETLVVQRDEQLVQKEAMVETLEGAPHFLGKTKDVGCDARDWIPEWYYSILFPEISAGP